MNTRELLEGLKEIHAAATSHREGKAVPDWFDSELGICGNMVARANRALDTDPLKPMFVSWQHYSGDLTYPAPDPQARVKPSRKYEATKDVWIGDYGDLRMNLLNHCIKALERSNT